VASTDEIFKVASLALSPEIKVKFETRGQRKGQNTAKTELNDASIKFYGI
jgi:hypothetical protein